LSIFEEALTEEERRGKSTLKKTVNNICKTKAITGEEISQDVDMLTSLVLAQ